MFTELPTECGAWSEWSQCSAKVGSGVHFRTRRNMTCDIIETEVCTPAGESQVVCEAWSECSLYTQIRQCQVVREGVATEVQEKRSCADELPSKCKWRRGTQL